jgi:hypothetical protein
MTYQTAWLRARIKFFARAIVVDDVPVNDRRIAWLDRRIFVRKVEMVVRGNRADDGVIDFIAGLEPPRRPRMPVLCIQWKNVWRVREAVEGIVVAEINETLRRFQDWWTSHESIEWIRRPRRGREQMGHWCSRPPRRRGGCQTVCASSWTISPSDVATRMARGLFVSMAADPALSCASGSTVDNNTNTTMANARGNVCLAMSSSSSEAEAACPAGSQS